MTQTIRPRNKLIRLLSIVEGLLAECLHMVKDAQVGDEITPILLDESFVLEVILPQMSPPAEVQFIRKIERIDQYGRRT